MHIPPQAVRAEQKQRGALRRAHEVERRAEEPPEFVGIARAEEAERIGLRRVFGVLPLQRLHVELLDQRVDEGPDESALVHPVHALRRRIDEVGVPRMEVVRHQNLGHERRSVHEQEDDPGNDGHAVALELPPHQHPLRGEVEVLLLGREAGGRRRIERRLGDEVPRLAGTSARAGDAALMWPPQAALRAAPQGASALGRPGGAIRTAALTPFAAPEHSRLGRPAALIAPPRR